MKKLGLLSFAASIAITSAMAGNVELLSDLKIYGDAEVRGISVKGDTDTAKKDKQVLDSKIRVNLDFKTLEGIVIHSRIELKNDAWGDNDNDTFTWDEANVLVPFDENKFLLAGRVNDTYGTPFYGSNGDKIDLALVGYKPVENVLLYAFDFKAVEGKNNDQNTFLGVNSTGTGDFDAYSVGGQVTLDKLVVGGRYVYLQNNTETSTGSTIYNDATSHMFNAFAMGEIADLDLQTQIEKRVGDKTNSSVGQSDEKMFGAYLKVAKQIDNFNIGFAALTTKDGYVSGENLPVTYLTNDDLGTASLDRVGKYGDTTLVALNLAYDVSNKLTLEGNLGQHNIKNATFSSIDKDLKITEYDAGLAYKLNKSATVSLRYALGTFDVSNLDDMQTVVAAVNINF
ncbi:hypothetical protein AVENP_0527 [Arcobacter venerupis]|uniref:Porin domain-containing protein n=1 Tax=Arcobacter venerupis TaxID=1054033 RepID=A0AAE7E3Y1_9BACT|nr:hypothetical protein [Arcobacter venerupis]QKF66101.1 hypothetical protein AVENP_0527 [Arcobacter venerupis]RWS51110.1 hypothetical protein CKA56_01910 [Arcobacter venerupis]